MGLVVLLAALLRFGFGEASEPLALGSIGVLGVLLALSWILVIRSYRQLNTEKFRVLHELERKLPFQFFILEWDPESTGGQSARYRQLTDVERSLPAVFLVLWVAVIIYAVVT